MVIDGTVFRVYVDGTPVAYAISSTMNLTRQMDEIAPTSLSSSNFTVLKPNRKSGNISTNALIGVSDNYDFGDLYNAWDGGTPLTIAFKSPGSGEWEVSTSAYITQISSTGAVSQDSTLRVAFAFSGASSLNTVA